jgi:hypothetical protein
VGDADSLGALVVLAECELTPLVLGEADPVGGLVVLADGEFVPLAVGDVDPLGSPVVLAVGEFVPLVVREAETVAELDLLGVTEVESVGEIGGPLDASQVAWYPNPEPAVITSAINGNASSVSKLPSPWT